MKTYCTGVNVDKIYSALFRDKKTVGGKINWVLMKTLGTVEISDAVPEEIIRDALKEITRREDE